MVDDMLADLDATGKINGVLNIAAGATPSGAGLVSKANLVAKGWTVTTHP
jgi:hypothetical protein